MLDDADGSALGVELDSQPVDLEERRGRRRTRGRGRAHDRGDAPPLVAPATTRLGRAERVAETVAERVEREHGDRDGDARDQQLPRVCEQGLVIRAAEHVPPAGIRELHAEAQEAQAGFGDERAAEAQRGGDEEWRADIGQDARPQHPGNARADRTRRLDEGLLGHGEGGPAGQTHEARHEHDGDGEGRVAEPGAEHAGNGDRQHEGREAQARVDEPHDDVVEPTSDVARQEPDRHGDHHRQHDDADADVQRDTRADHDPAPQVLAEVVRPEPVVPRRGRELVQHVLSVGIVGLDQAVERRDEREDAEERERRDRPPIPPEPLPGAPARAGRRDRRDFLADGRKALQIRR